MMKPKAVKTFFHCFHIFYLFILSSCICVFIVFLWLSYDSMFQSPKTSIIFSLLTMSDFVSLDCMTSIYYHALNINDNTCIQGTSNNQCSSDMIIWSKCSL